MIDFDGHMTNLPFKVKNQNDVEDSYAGMLLLRKVVRSIYHTPTTPN